VSKVTYVLIKNSLINICMILLFIIVFVKPGVVTKYGVRTKTIDNVVRAFAFLLLLIALIPAKDLMIDFYGFLKSGNRYLQKATCEVIRETHTVWFSFAQRVIYCSNGQHFVDRFTSSFYHEGERYELIYLPKTRLIVDKRRLD